MGKKLFFTLFLILVSVILICTIYLFLFSLKQNVNADNGTINTYFMMYGVICYLCNVVLVISSTTLFLNKIDKIRIDPVLRFISFFVLPSVIVFFGYVLDDKRNLRLAGPLFIPAFLSIIIGYLYFLRVLKSQKNIINT